MLKVCIGILVVFVLMMGFGFTCEEYIGLVVKDCLTLLFYTMVGICCTYVGVQMWKSGVLTKIFGTGFLLLGVLSVNYLFHSLQISF